MINGNCQFKSDAILSLLISEKLLPVEIYRLPRFSKEIIKFDPIETYCNTCSDASHIISENSEYYASCPPMILTYDETIDHFKKNGKNENELWQACFNNTLGAYLKISHKNISVTSIPNNKIAWPNKRRANCGNPFYLKRYNGLEKLLIKESDSRLSLEALWKNERLQIFMNIGENGVLEHAPYDNFLQTTDIETKFHLIRSLKSFNGKKSIEISNLVFLEEEVKNIAKTFRREAAIYEPSSADKIIENNNWKNLNNLLKNISSDLKSKGKMVTIYSAIKAVLKTIKAVDPKFNCMDMPGNVSDFQEFCLTLPYGASIFPKINKITTSSQKTFHRYCKGKIKGKNEKHKPALCAWGSKPVSNPNYWSNIKNYER